MKKQIFLALTALLTIFFAPNSTTAQDNTGKCYFICHRLSNGTVSHGTEPQTLEVAKGWLSPGVWLKNICDTTQPDITYESIVVSVPKIGNARMSFSDQPGGITVFMQEFGTAQANDPDPILETVGAGPCITVTMYDTISHIGSMVHLAHMVLQQSMIEDAFQRSWLDKMLESMNKAGYQDTASVLQIHIIGGQTGQSENLYFFIDSLLREKNLNDNVVEVDFGGYTSRSILLDTRTGQVFDLIHIIPFRNMTKEDEQIMQMRVMSAIMPEVNYTTDKKAEKKYGVR